jgi:hypothetical protein
MAEHEEDVMDATTAPTSGKPDRRLDWLAAGGFLLVLLGCGFVLASAGAWHREFYGSMGIMLPFFTKLALLVGLSCRHYWYAGIIVGLALAVAPVLLLRNRRSWPLHAWGVGAVLLLTLLTYTGMTHGCPRIRKFLNAAGVPGDAYCGSNPAKLAPSLALALKSPDAHLRAEAAHFLLALSQLLQRQKRLPPEVEPALTMAVKDEDILVRVYAAGTLWRITGKSDVAKPILLEGLKSSYRGEVLRIVGFFGPEAAELLPAVRELLKDEDHFVARNAQDTLDRLEGRDPWARRTPK